ncbi:hypothetical protein [Endozoicomonas sp. 8E]|uniref:hypothetical protein n=1 Tax=Endozoicomonas sp. 8E TaxID=3035692 RepID=UPI002938E773|nr:hypothetical protein [Endozoicomonas sp. 8E]WOG26956.1 hypothetical protein P6910_20760 [Endozoicomonas sp. 8E]
MTKRFIVELKQSADFTNQNFSMASDRHTLSDEPSDIADTNDYAKPDLPSNDKQHRPDSSGLKATLIESISWQWLYATNLLVTHELILTINEAPLHSNAYSWLAAEAVIVIWILKNFWNPDSPFFNPKGQQEASQNHPIAIITKKPGSENNPVQYRTSQPSGQQAPAASTQGKDAFTSLLHSSSGDGNGDPQAHRHTLGLNCFIYPCHGICRFGPSSDNAYPIRTGGTYASLAQPPNHSVTIPGHLPVSSDDVVIINGLLNLDNHGLVEKTWISCTLPHFTPPTGTLKTQQTIELFQWGQSPTHLSRTAAVPSPTASGKVIFTTPNHRASQTRTLESTGATYNRQVRLKHKRSNLDGQQACNAIMFGEGGLKQPCGKSYKSPGDLSVHKSKVHTGKKTCHTSVIRKDGQQRPCGTVCKNAQSLAHHKSKEHTGQQICNAIVVGKGGLQQPCGKTCKSARNLSIHKSKYHTGQKTCYLSVIGKDGQQQPCGAVCKNAQALSHHKSKDHSGQQTCEVTVISEDGQPRPCGVVCKSTQSLIYHRRRDHSGQQTCDVTVIGEDDQLRPCGMVFKNAPNLAAHRSRFHTGQKICDITLVSEDGTQRPCGTACQSARALINHKRRSHSVQRACYMTVVRKDGQQLRCGKICKNAAALSTHKSSVHSGQKTCYVTVVGEDGQQRPCGKVCSNAGVLYDHRRKHLKRKPVDVGTKR